MVSRIASPAVVLSLAIAWPFLNFVQANHHRLSLSDYVISFLGFLLFLILIGLIVFTVHRLIGSRTATFCTFGGAAASWIFLNYKPIKEGLFSAAPDLSASISVNLIYLAVLIVVFGIFGVVGLNRVGRVAFGAFCAVVCLTALTTLSLNITAERHAGGPASEQVTQQRDDQALSADGNGYENGYWYGQLPEFKAADRSPTTLPNVYYLILDEYARADVLEKTTGFNNSKTVSALRDNGFRVFERAYANYPKTFLSLSASLGMQYPAGEGTVVNDAPFYRALGGRNAAVDLFKSLGYTFALMPTNQWGGSNCGDQVDYCLEPDRPIIAASVNRSWETINLLVGQTPFSYFLKFNIISESYEPVTLDHIIGYWKNLEALRPYFLFSHTIPPHAPFVFRADCSRQKTISFDLRSDGSPQRELYLDNLQCASRRMLELVEHIATNDPDAIVIIKSDHGSQFLWSGRTTADQVSLEGLHERMGILLAIRFPDHCDEMIYDRISPVNLLRFAAACATGTTVSFLEDKSYPVREASGNGYFVVDAPRDLYGDKGP